MDLKTLLNNKAPQNLTINDNKYADQQINAGVNAVQAPLQADPAAFDPDQTTFKPTNLEAVELKKARKEFKDADLCTVRESRDMKIYYKNRVKNGEPEDKARGGADDPILREYVESILAFKPKAEHFTDEYLSHNIVRMYKYTRRLRKLSSLESKYPEFFNSLSADKLNEIRNRSLMADDMSDILSHHLYYHGILMKKGKAGPEVYLRNSKTEKKKISREEENSKYLGELGIFLRKYFAGQMPDDGADNQSGIQENIRQNEQLNLQENIQHNDQINIQVNEQQGINAHQTERISGTVNYNAFREAADALGTGVGFFDSREMEFVKKHLKGLKQALKGELPAKGNDMEFLRSRTTVLQNISALMDSCSIYMSSKEKDRDHELKPRYVMVRNLMESARKLETYFSSLSEERFAQVRKGCKSFAEIAGRDESGNADSEQVIREARSLALRREHDSLGEMYSELKGDSASKEILAWAGALKKVLKKQIPANYNGKADKKVLEAYETLIEKCKKYSNTQTPHFAKGKNRLDLVRRIMQTVTREYNYIKSVDVTGLALENKCQGTWEDMLSRGPLLLRGDRLDRDQILKNDDDGTRSEFIEKPGEAGAESISMSELLGVTDAYTSLTHVIRVDSSGRILRGVLRSVPVPTDDGRGMVFKNTSDILEFAKEHGINAVYSSDALHSLSSIRIMDYLTGRTGRSDGDLLYESEVRNVAGEKTLLIKNVKTFGNNILKGDADPVTSGLCDAEGRFLIPYDTAFADRIINADARTLIKQMRSLGADPDEEAFEAFTRRLASLKEMLIKDRDAGWRSGLENENAKEGEAKQAAPEDIQKGFSNAQSLPDYISTKLIRERTGPGGTSDSSAPVGEAENVWLSKEGAPLNAVSYNADVMSQEEIKELNELKGEENLHKKIRRLKEIDLKTQIRNKKKKLKLLKDFRSAGSRSAYLMKKKKQQLARDVAKEMERINEETSQDYKDIMKDLESYASTLASAQWEWTDELRKTGKIISGKSQLSKFLISVSPVRTKRERQSLARAKSKINKRLVYLEGKNERSKMTLSEAMEYDNLKKWKARLTKASDGGLKVPKSTKTVKVEHIREGDYSLKGAELIENKDVSQNAPAANADKNKTKKKKKVSGTVRLKDIRLRDEKDMPLFAHDPCIEDVCQGRLGDCYALASIAAVVDKDPDYIRNMMKDNGDGTVTVRLYHMNGAPMYVTVKKEVPVFPDSKNEETDFYAKNCLWVQMLEKAFALSGLVKEHKSEFSVPDSSEQGYVYNELDKNKLRTYDSLTSGNAENVMKLLLGNVQTGFIRIFDKAERQEIEKGLNGSNSAQYEKRLRDRANEILGKIKDYESQGMIMTCGSRTDLQATDGKGFSGGEPMTMGIAGNHEYTILGVKRIGNEEYIAIRNPWGMAAMEHEVNEDTGALVSRGNYGESGLFLVTPLEFTNFFSLVNISRTGQKGNVNNAR